MYRPSIILSLSLSLGLHVAAFSGVSVLSPNSDSSRHGPVEVELVAFSTPTPYAGAWIPSVAVVKSDVPVAPLVTLPRAAEELQRRALLVSSGREPETIENTFPDRERLHDTLDGSVPAEDREVEFSRVARDVPVREDSVAHGGRLVAFPADATPSHREEWSGMTRPDVQYLSSMPPRYPRLARQRGWEGTVLLVLEVLPSGAVGTIGVARTSGHPMLDRAATRAVREWRFAVNQLDGSGVTATVEIPVTFTLDATAKRRG